MNFKDTIARVKGKSREVYFPSIDEIAVTHASITVVDNCMYTGGLFDIQDPMFLNEIITTKGLDLTDTERCITFLTSPLGLKIQKGKFRNTIYKKVRKYCKNRGIYNRQLFLLLLTYKANDTNFDELVTHLDKSKNYTLFEVARFTAISSISSSSL